MLENIYLVKLREGDFYKSNQHVRYLSAIIMEGHICPSSMAGPVSQADSLPECLPTERGKHSGYI
jgi:hypothetical protein